MVGAVCWISTSAFIGPFSRLVGRADLSIYIGSSLAGGIYWLTARRRVHLKTDQSEAAEPAGLAATLWIWLSEGDLPMCTTLNLIWIFFAGIWLALGYGLAGTFMLLLIITIPFGFAPFRLAPLCSGRSAARL
jgi:hypothetical protein